MSIQTIVQMTGKRMSEWSRSLGLAALGMAVGVTVIGLVWVAYGLAPFSFPIAVVLTLAIFGSITVRYVSEVPLKARPHLDPSVAKSRAIRPLRSYQRIRRRVADVPSNREAAERQASRSSLGIPKSMGQRIHRAGEFAEPAHIRLR